MTSKSYLVLTILFVNIKFIQQIILILARITDHRASEPPTHDTIVCPICGTIFFERDVFKIHVSNCSPKKMTTGLHGDLFSSNAHLPEYSEEDDYITSPESFRAESDSSENESNNEEAPDDEISYIGNKKVLKGTFDNLKKIKVEKIPFDIDGKKVYHVTAQTRTKLLEKLKDGRQWKKDSRTTWSDFKEVRYRNCYGGYACPNVDCNYLLQFGKPNKVNFEKDGTCKTCWATGKKIHVFRIRASRTLFFSYLSQKMR